MFLRSILCLYLLSFSSNAISAGLVELQAFGLTEGWDREAESPRQFTNRKTRYYSNDIVYKKSGLQKSQLNSKKVQHQKESLSCYKSLLKRKPKAHGKVFFKFKVSSKNGKISSLKVSPSHWADTKFKNCVNNSLLSKRFNIEKGRDVTVSYPLVFKTTY